MSSATHDLVKQMYFLIRLDQFQSGVWGASLDSTSSLYGRPSDPGSISVSTACSLALSAISGNSLIEPTQRLRRYLFSRRTVGGGFGMRRALGSSRYPVETIQAHARHTASAVRFFLHFDGIDHDAVIAGTNYLLDAANRTASGLWVDHGPKVDERVDPITVSAVVGCLEAVREAVSRSLHSITEIRVSELDSAIVGGLESLLQSPFRLKNGLWIYRFEDESERERLVENTHRYSAGVLLEAASASVRTGVGLAELRHVAQILLHIASQYDGGLPQGATSNIPSMDATANLLCANDTLSESISGLLTSAKQVLVLLSTREIFARSIAPDWAAFVHLGTRAGLDITLSQNEIAELDSVLEKVDNATAPFELPEQIEVCRAATNRIVDRKRRTEGSSDRSSATTSAIVNVNITEPLKNPVYVSYAWGDGTRSGKVLEALVDRLFESLQASGFTVRRDKMHLEYRDSISDFMGEMGVSPRVIAIISDKYLRSENCMHELIEVWRNLDLQKRLFPIVLSGLKLHKLSGRIDYVKYWTDQLDQASSEMETLRRENLSTVGVQSQYDRLRRIAQNVDEVLTMLADMNTLTPEKLEADSFAIVRSALGTP